MKVTLDENLKNINKNQNDIKPVRPVQKKDMNVAAAVNSASIKNNAYGNIQKKDDVKEMFGAQMDVDVQRKMMTVLSNCMSEEDYKKVMEDGFQPSDMDPEELVTVVDRIKAELAKAGVVIKGYNDDLDEEQLKEIVGNAGQAKDILRELKENDLPANRENVSAVSKTLRKAEEIEELQDGSKKYLLENGLELSVDSLYKAAFSATGDGSRQGQGYYPQECSGYFAEKAQHLNWEDMKSQLETVIFKMGQTEGSMEEKLEQGKWLIEKGIPVTGQTMEQLQKIDSLSFPLNPEKVIKAAVFALSKGREPGQQPLEQVPS